MRWRALKLCAFLLLGAIISVAVAWGFAWYSTGYRITSEDWQYLSDAEVNAFWKRNSPPEWSNTQLISGAAMARLGKTTTSVEAHLLPAATMPDYGVQGSINNSPGSLQPIGTKQVARQANVVEFAFGIPCRSLRWVVISGELANKQLGRREGAYDAEWFGVPTFLGTTPTLPLLPVWPGFGINTIFYAAILWLLVATSGFVRRRIRARRGQCPVCAYPVGSSNVCTECGRPVRLRAANAIDF